MSSSPTQHPTINTSAEPPKTELITTVPIVSVSIAVAFMVAGLSVYHKKHKANLATSKTLFDWIRINKNYVGNSLDN